MLLFSVQGERGGEYVVLSAVNIRHVPPLRQFAYWKTLISFPIGSITSAINDPCFLATVTSLSGAQNTLPFSFFVHHLASTFYKEWLYQA